MKFLSLLPLLVVFSLINLCTSEKAAAAPPPRFFFEILYQYGLPTGLFPETARYNLSGDGYFELYLDDPCYLKFDYWAYYNTKISGKLSMGSITNMNGVLGRAFYVVWVNVDDVLVDVPATDTIYFNTWFFTLALDLYKYVTIRPCIKALPVNPLLQLPTAGDVLVTE